MASPIPNAITPCTISPRKAYPQAYQFYFGTRNPSSRLWLMPDDLRGMILLYLAKSMFELISEREAAHHDRIEEALSLSRAAFFRENPDQKRETLFEYLPVSHEEYKETFAKVVGYGLTLNRFLNSQQLTYDEKELQDTLEATQRNLEELNHITTKASYKLRGKSELLEFNRSRTEQYIAQLVERQKAFRLLKQDVALGLDYFKSMRSKVLTALIDGLFFPQRYVDLEVLSVNERELVGDISSEEIVTSNQFAAKCLQNLKKPIMRMSFDGVDYTFIAILINDIARVLVLVRSCHRWDLVNDFLLNPPPLEKVHLWRSNMCDAPAHYQTLKYITCDHRTMKLVDENNNNKRLARVKLITQAQLNSFLNHRVTRITL